MKGVVKKKALHPRDWEHFFDSRQPAISQIMQPVDSAALYIELARCWSRPVANHESLRSHNPMENSKHAGGFADQSPI